MTKRSKYGLISLVFFALALIAGVEVAYATGNKHDDDIDIDTRTTTDQHQAQDQMQGQEQHAAGGAGGNADNNLQIDASESNRVENNSSNVVLVPNNNTENCLRVFGFAWGENGTSGAFGVPWRSKACDFEQAADDAFAAGERELGWWWKCHNKTLYKPFYDRPKGGSRDTAKDAAIEACTAKAIGEITKNDVIGNLKAQLEFLQDERAIERQQYTESVNRLNEACNESKDRILDACKK